MISLVPRTARTVDLAIGERSSGPILVRHAAYVVVAFVVGG